MPVQICTNLFISNCGNLFTIEDLLNLPSISIVTPSTLITFPSRPSCSIRSSVDSPGGSQEIRPLSTIPTASGSSSRPLTSSSVAPSAADLSLSLSTATGGGGAAPASSSAVSATAFDLDSDFEVEAEAKDWRLNVGREVLDKMSKKEQKRQDVINGEKSLQMPHHFVIS